MNKKTYGPLDELIDSTGLKKTVIANRMEVKYSTFYKWRVNPRVMSIENMEKLAKILGTDFISIYEISKKFRNEVA